MIGYRALKERDCGCAIMRYGGTGDMDIDYCKKHKSIDALLGALEGLLGEVEVAEANDDLPDSIDHFYVEEARRIMAEVTETDD